MCVLLVAAGAACGAAANPGSGTSNAVPAATTNSSPDRLLQQIASQLGDEAYATVSLGQPPEGFASNGDKWVYSTLDPSKQQQDGAPDQLKATWEIFLIAGAYRAQAPGQGFPPAGGTSIDPIRSNGSTDDIAMGSSVDKPEDVPEPVITGRIEKAAAEAGMKLASIGYLHADLPAPVVTLIADDPAAFVKSHPHPVGELVGSDTYAGDFVEVDDSVGNPVLIQFRATLSGINAVWYRPDLAPTSLASLL